jgi:acylphosphatase
MKKCETFLNRRTILYTGNVQGVGFRYTTQHIAQQFAVQGFVRNLPDGRVELVVEGTDAEMDRLIDTIQQRMAGFIRATNIQSSPATGEFAQFSIRH